MDNAIPETLHREVENKAREILERENIMPDSRQNRITLLKEIMDEVLGLGPLEKLLANDEVTEIMVNGANMIFVETNGQLKKTNSAFIDNHHVLRVIERIIMPLGKRLDESSPYVDARLADGSRVNAIISPLSLEGPILTIRKFNKTIRTIDSLIKNGTLNENMAKFIKLCVLSRKNIIISGGTGSGKTTLLNMVSGFIPVTERIVTIEDSAELRLPQEHVVRLESKPSNIEGKGSVTIRDLVRNALRMRPDRIVIGECRGGETFDMLQAMNTGHDGSITTVHANSSRDALSRIETMVLMAGMDLPIRAIREQLASAIQIVIQMTRFLCDGSRKIIQISELTGVEQGIITMQDIFRFNQKGIGASGKVMGDFNGTGFVPAFLEELKTGGFNVDMELFQ
jgi:pilus assembly protein CpaF